jgi:molybdenum cofactor biosynthesis enzyme MoaA
VSELRPNQRNQYRALWELARGLTQVASTPPSLQLARSNTCNFKCVYCIDHRAGNQVPRVQLQGDVWENLVSLIPRSTSLGFHGISEFFVDREFFDILHQCAASGVALSLNTNASVCSPRHLDALANYPGYIWITFSLDAATPETFLRIRGQDFWRTVGNVKAYIDRFQPRRSETHVSLSFVITRSSVREMTPFLYLGKALGVDSVTYFRLHEYDGLDWEVETRHGGSFNYRGECVGTFAAQYNEELERVRRAAVILGVKVDLPAPAPAAIRP